MKNFSIHALRAISYISLPVGTFWLLMHLIYGEGRPLPVSIWQTATLILVPILIILSVQPKNTRRIHNVRIIVLLILSAIVVVALMILGGFLIWNSMVKYEDGVRKPPTLLF